jgi:translation initiation factor IF-1
MAGESAFKVEGLVVETMPNRLYRVQLSNGHKVLAYATGKAKETFAAKTGDKVKLQMSPYDLSEGRIIVETKNLT